MTDHEQLAARIEALEGPDRAVDAEIWWLCGPGKKDWPQWAGETAIIACGRIFGQTPHKTLSWETVGYNGPAYTASLDAAMSLVPEGWRVRDFSDWEDRWTLWLMNEETCQDVGARAGRGRPALALCAAAIRARI